MISLADVYHVVAAIVPLYIAMILAYISVKWFRLFTHDQCSGINKFVAKFSIPLLSFQVISANNPFKMNLRLVFSDAIQKLLAFFLLAVLTKIGRRGKFSWIITGISLSTLPNTLILGIPLLKSMYGEEAAALLAQIVMLQSVIWNNLLSFMFELNASKAASKRRTLLTTGEGEASLPDQKEEGVSELHPRPRRRSSTFSLLMAVGWKVLINPNTHATVLGLIWATIHFRWRRIEMPVIVDNSISILAKGGLGMAMFSLGLFMALQAQIIGCGVRLASYAMAVRFLLGPALMSVPSLAVGLRGQLLRVAILQAALPQGIVPFVFAKEYDVHAEILSTGIVLGLLVAIPIALAYYFLLAL